MTSQEHPPQLALAEARVRASSVQALPVVQRAIHEAMGHVLAEPVEALLDIPHAATSAMDGWAVAGPGPWHLLEAEATGPEQLLPPLERSQAVALVTGSPIPDGATSVLRSEHGTVTPASAPGGPRVLHADPSTRDTEPGRHIRPAAAEAGKGERLLSPGCELTPPRAAVAAVGGHDALSVHRRPRAALIYTGEEVITGGLPAIGQVRDTFAVSLPAALAAMRAEVSSEHRLGDDVERLSGLLRELCRPAGPDLVLTTGGTGHSAADTLRPALQSLGAEVEQRISSVDMRPGHPVTLARVATAESQTYVLGLPGNPLAGMAALVAIGSPLIDALRGVEPGECRRTVEYRAGADLHGARRGLRLLPARLQGGEVYAIGFDTPTMMRGLAEADVFAMVPPEGLPEGAATECLPLPFRAR